jgi:hypothetical protein
MLNLVSGGNFSVLMEALANTPHSIPFSGNNHTEFKLKKNLIKAFREMDIFLLVKEKTLHLKK